jgi:hypothetical protein
MERIPIEEFRRVADHYDGVVRATPEIDRFCSVSDWLFAARAAWGDRAPARILRGKHGYAAFQDHTDPDGTRLMLSFDSMWGFNCPLVGEDPAALVDEFADYLAGCPSTWQVVLISGLRRDSQLFRSLAEVLGERYLLRVGSPMRRWIASLEGGLNGYLARRSSKLRESLRAARRKAEGEGIEMRRLRVDSVAEAEKVFHRLLDIEERSWKGPESTGLLIDEMQDFYREVTMRWAKRGALRAIFARCRGEDVGYILGGTWDRIYRGFQFSFDRRFKRYSLGNLMQGEQIRELCDEGFETYDLGIDMAYKRRWAESVFDTFTLAVLRVA